METLRMGPKTLHALKSEIIGTDRTLFKHLDSSAVFSDYLMKSKTMVKRLHNMSVKFNNRGQWTALVAAIKQEQNIYDTVIKHGQDFGFIDKKAAESKVTLEGELTFSAATPEAMKKEIAKQVKELNTLAEGGVIEMRKELLGITDADVESFVPSSVIDVKAQKPKSKAKAKSKVKLRLRKNS